MSFTDFTLPQPSPPPSWAKCVSASCVAPELELGSEGSHGARKECELKIIDRWHAYNVCAFAVLIVLFFIKPRSVNY